MSAFRWKATVGRDGYSTVYTLRPREFDAVEAFAARCLQSEDELMDDLLARASAPLTMVEDEPEELLVAPTDERTVARLAVEVGEAAEAERMTFVADVRRRALVAPSGRVIRGGWAALDAHLRERGVRLGQLRDGEAVIRNAHGEVRVARDRPVFRYLDGRGRWRVR